MLQDALALHNVRGFFINGLRDLQTLRIIMPSALAQVGYERLALLVRHILALHLAQRINVLQHGERAQQAL